MIPHPNAEKARNQADRVLGYAQEDRKRRNPAPVVTWSKMTTVLCDHPPLPPLGITYLDAVAQERLSRLFGIPSPRRES